MIHVSTIAAILSRLGERDLVVKPARCVRLRSPRSKCNKCEEACPHGVISWEGGLSIDPLLCDGCGSCAAVCMNDVFILSNNDPTMNLERAYTGFDQNEKHALAGVRIKCERAARDHLPEQDNSILDLQVPCYGALDGSFFANTFIHYTDSIEMCLADCPNCSRSKGLDLLSLWIEKDSRISLAAPGSTIDKPLIKTIKKIDSSTVFSRRGFFSRFGSAIVGEEAPPPVSLNNSAIVSRSLPDKQKRLIDSNGLEQWSSISKAEIIKDDCDYCGQCWMLCPTGALENRHDTISDGLIELGVTFDPVMCTGCMLCEDVCKSKAFVLHQRLESPLGTLEPTKLVSFAGIVCNNCGKPTPIAFSQPREMALTVDQQIFCRSCRNNSDIDDALSELVEI